VREYSGFSVKSGSATVTADPVVSDEIVRELLRGYSRLGYAVDLDDGFDSLEVSTEGFAIAWKALGCSANSKEANAKRRQP
jgi:hypothetical protein